MFGYTDGRIDNVQTYQYSENGKKASDKETSWLVKGNQNVGGNIGTYAGGGNWVTNLRITNSKISGNNTVGGNVGWGSGNGSRLTSGNNTVTGTGYHTGGNVGAHGWAFLNMTSSNNTIKGNINVGGNTGKAGWATDGNLT